MKVTTNKLLLLIIGILIRVSIGFSQNSFGLYQTITTGSEAELVTIADVNNDGLNDVIVGTKFGNDAANDFRLFIFYQLQNGNLSTPTKYQYPHPSINGINSISTGDLNDDSLTDIVVGYHDSVGIFFQNTSGTLNPIVRYYVGKTQMSLKVGDLNADNKDDIATASYDSNYVKVFYQINGGFVTQKYPFTYQGSKEIDIGDFNDDGKKDIALVSGGSSGGLHIYLQNAFGLLNNPVNYFSALNTWGFNGMAVGDLNKDGRDDVAITEDGNVPNSKVFLYYQNSIGTLNPPVIFSAYNIPEPIEIADLTCDGTNEIITVHGGWQAVSLYYQSTSGSMIPGYSLLPISYASHYLTHGLSVGDINNDGSKDICIADYNYGLVILKNNSGAPSSGFTNFDTLVVADTIYHNNFDLNSRYGLKIQLNSDSLCNVFRTDSFFVKQTFTEDSIKIDSNFVKSVMKCTLYSKTTTHSNTIYVTAILSIDSTLFYSKIDTILSPMIVYDTLIQNLVSNRDTLIRMHESTKQTVTESSSGCSKVEKEIFLISTKMKFDSLIIDTTYYRKSVTCLITKRDSLFKAYSYLDSTIIAQDTLLHTNTIDTVFSNSGEQYELCNLITIHPSPTNGICTIEISDPCFKYKAGEFLDLKLFDTMGKLIQHNQLNSMQNPSNSLDLSIYANGIYCLSFGIGNEFCIKKVVKEK